MQNGNTVLLAACEAGDYEIVELVIGQGAFINMAGMVWFYFICFQFFKLPK